MLSILKHLQKARHSGKPLLEELARLTGTELSTLAQNLGQQLNCPLITADDIGQLQADHSVLPLNQSQQWQIALFKNAKNQWTGLLCDPFDEARLLSIEASCAAPINWRLALPADLQACLQAQEAQMQTLGSIAQVDDSPTQQGWAIEELTLASATQNTGQNNQAVRFVNATLYDAMKLGASDVHIECTAIGLATRLRVDGLLGQPTLASGQGLAAQVISRIKVLAQLDIAETRIPQDGSYRVAYSGREIDLRVSIMPSTLGEDAVIRVLDKQNLAQAKGGLSLNSLGFPAPLQKTLRDLVKAPHGMLLVTGPTGSGKTTTLYAALSEVNHFSQKIITIEDPVEYQLEGVLQIPVNEKKGLTFAKGLRSILRHDPDKIMVGEIRDRETAEIAVQSALTGHLVLSTVHANSSFDVFQRFAHMGVDLYTFVSALNGITAQRLLRLVCKHCSAPAQHDTSTLQALGIDPAQAGQLRQGTGCTHCLGTGYKSRIAVAEVLRMSPDIAEAVLSRQSPRVIRELAAKAGTRTLLEASRELALQGLTSVDELSGVAVIAY